MRRCAAPRVLAAARRGSAYDTGPWDTTSVLEIGFSADGRPARDAPGHHGRPALRRDVLRGRLAGRVPGHLPALPLRAGGEAPRAPRVGQAGGLGARADPARVELSLPLTSVPARVEPRARQQPPLTHGEPTDAHHAALERHQRARESR